MRGSGRYFAYLSVGAALLLVLCLPSSFGDRLRLNIASVLSPLWRKVHAVHAAVSGDREISTELESVQLENRLLRSQVESLRVWLFAEEWIEKQMQRLSALQSEPLSDWRSFFERRREQLKERLAREISAMSAKITLREPTSWSSSVWIDVGERDNEALGRVIIAKNSPVLSGFALVGIVEEVGLSESRVRLISDAKLSVAVRAVRGAESAYGLLEPIDLLLTAVEVRNDFFMEAERKQAALQLLRSLKEALCRNPIDCYLAKGELQGSGMPLWRSRGGFLKGVGFNYEFSDAEGMARDLRAREGILKEGDLLVTSGLEGIFPVGLPVALVHKVMPLSEGACTYELEARPLSGNLDRLSHFFVLPPLRYL